MRALPRVARKSAPQSAPAPKTDAIRPNTSASASSVSPASSGSSTSKLNEIVLSASTAKNATATLRERRTNEAITRRLRRSPVCTSGGTYGAQLADPHREQSDHDGPVAGRVHGEGDADPGQGDDETAERRPDDARRRAQRRAERDRVRQVVLPDDPEHERVPRRVADHEDEPLEDRDHVHLPELDRARQRQDCERAGGDDRERLRHEQEAADVEAVDHRADREAEERHRQELGEGERSDGERRSGQVEHEPVRGDLLHPRADERDAVADEVEPVVAVVAQAREGPSADPRDEAHLRGALAGRSAGRS